PAGHRFLACSHPNAELAPRDVVSRASFAVMEAFGATSVFLDATVIEDIHGTGTLARRFPQLTAMLETHGIDWTTQYVPVVPAAISLMVGFATHGRASSFLRWLLAAGEVASTGGHGAIRLASNSLLEGLAFGALVAATAHDFLRETPWQVEPQLHA